MVSLYADRYRLVVYPNDHPPPHVHVMGAGWEIRIAITHPPVVLSIGGRAKRTDVMRSLVVVANKRLDLMRLWESVHGE